MSADHAHTSQIVAEDAEGDGPADGLLDQPAHQGRPDARADVRHGRLRRARRGPVAEIPSQQHTGAVVPVWGKGPGSLAVLGTNDHTDLFHTLGG